MRKLFILATALILVLGLNSCGKSKSGDAKQDAADSTQAQKVEAVKEPPLKQGEKNDKYAEYTYTSGTTEKKNHTKAKKLLATLQEGRDAGLTAALKAENESWTQLEKSLPDARGYLNVLVSYIVGASSVMMSGEDIDPGEDGLSYYRNQCLKDDIAAITGKAEVGIDCATEISASKLTSAANKAVSKFNLKNLSSSQRAVVKENSYGNDMTSDYLESYSKMKRSVSQLVSSVSSWLEARTKVENSLTSGNAKSAYHYNTLKLVNTLNKEYGKEWKDPKDMEY